ncbi:unnamed protein product, partial [Rotaria sp. Silwood2]
GFVSPEQERQGRSPSRRRLSNRLRRQGPRQIRLKDFMPTELREPSPNLPPDFNIATATALAIKSTNILSDALPQCERFLQNNTTQPFTVTGNNQNKQQRQQQIKDNVKPRLHLDVENVTRPYLESTRILKWLEDHSRTSNNAISSRGNQAYVLASASSYDNWVRNNYESQVWQTYLKMGTEQKHWAKEVIRRTKRRDDLVNTRFVQKKINRLTTNIARVYATISELQIQLSTYWMHTSSETTNQRLAQTTANIVAKKLLVEKARSTVAPGHVGTDREDELTTGTTELIPPAALTTAATKNYAREPVERI